MTMKKSKPIALDRRDVHSLLDLVGGSSAVVAVGIIAMLSVCAAFFIYRSFRGQRRKSDENNGSETSGEDASSARRRKIERDDRPTESTGEYQDGKHCSESGNLSDTDNVLLPTEISEKDLNESTLKDLEEITDELLTDFEPEMRDKTDSDLDQWVEMDLDENNTECEDHIQHEDDDNDEGGREVLADVSVRSTQLDCQREEIEEYLNKSETGLVDTDEPSETESAQELIYQRHHQVTSSDQAVKQSNPIKIRLEEDDKTSTVEEGNKTSTVEEGDKTSAVEEGDKTSAVEEGDKTSAVEEGDKTSAVEEGDKTSAVEEGDKTSAVEEGDKTSAVEEGDKTSAVEEGDKTSAVEEGDKTSAVEEGDKTSAVEEGDKTSAVEEASKKFEDHHDCRFPLTNNFDCCCYDNKTMVSHSNRFDFHNYLGFHTDNAFLVGSTTQVSLSHESGEKKTNEENASIEENHEKNEISIMDAIMDNNEWLIVGASEVRDLPWLTPTATSVEEKQTQLEKEGQVKTGLAKEDEEPANKRVATVPPLSQGVSVTFRIHYITSSPSQLVAVSGSLQELGAWESFVPLYRAKDGFWAVTITLPVESQVEWKFVLVEEGRISRWEECGNRYLFLTSQDEEVYLDKWWGCF